MASQQRRRWGLGSALAAAAVVFSGVVAIPAAGVAGSPPVASAARSSGAAGASLLQASAAVTDTATVTATVGVTATLGVMATVGITPTVAATATVAVTPTVTTTTVATPTVTVVTPTVVTPTVTTTATGRAASATTTSTTLVRGTTIAPSATATTSVVSATGTTTATTTSRATLVVTPTTVAQGGLINATGVGYQPGETVRFSLGGQTLAQTFAGTTGALAQTGFGVPYTTTTGAHVITSTGVTSGRVATATVNVVGLTPTITTTTTSVTTGSTIVISGCNFAVGERVVLSLNGSALVTAPSVITTTSSGCFQATVQAPASLLAGPNTLSATGASSRATAQLALTGRLPVPSTFYFAGVSTMAGEHPALAVLNPTNQTATVTVTLMYTAQAPVTRALTVQPHARLTTDLLALGASGMRFGVKLTADRQISASVTERRDGKDQWSTPGVSAPNSTWYLAEGYTGLTFKEYISVLNPNASTAVVTLRLLPFNGKPASAYTYNIPAQREVFIQVNSLLRGQSLSAIVSSALPVVAQRTMTFGSGDFGAHAKVGTNLSAVNWYFAEGSTLNNFETYLTVLNPNANQAAFVTASYFSATGASLGNQTIRVDALRRGNFKLNDYVRANAISTIVSSNAPVVVERPLYFGPPNGGPSGGSDVFGRNGTATSFSFPEGNTSTMKEFLLLLNPTSRTANVRVRFYTTGGQVVSRTFSVTPFTRRNLDVNREVTNLPTGDHGSIVESTNGVGVVVEQSIFSANFRSGSSSQGIVR